MFRGAAKVTLDDKGRVVIPTRYRERFAERSQGQVVVTVDRDGECLLVYPLNDWEQVERRIMELPSLDPKARSLQRLIVGHASDVQLDGHGRMLVPPELRPLAALERHAMWVGQGNRCELWDEARWTARRDAWLQSDAQGGSPAQFDSLSL